MKSSSHSLQSQLLTTVQQPLYSSSMSLPMLHTPPLQVRQLRSVTIPTTGRRRPVYTRRLPRLGETGGLLWLRLFRTKLFIKMWPRYFPIQQLPGIPTTLLLKAKQISSTPISKNTSSSTMMPKLQLGMTMVQPRQASMPPLGDSNALRTE